METFSTREPCGHRLPTGRKARSAIAARSACPLLLFLRPLILQLRSYLIDPHTRREHTQIMHTPLELVRPRPPLYCNRVGFRQPSLLSARARLLLFLPIMYQFPVSIIEPRFRVCSFCRFPYPGMVQTLGCCGAHQLILAGASHLRRLQSRSLEKGRQHPGTPDLALHTGSAHVHR